MDKFKRVFVPHPNLRFEEGPLLEIADNIVYICNSPMFDDFIGLDFSSNFEGKVVKSLSDFNPDEDVIADFGDVLIFAMAIFYLSGVSDRIKVARYSKKKNEYLVREISEEQFDNFEET